MKIQPSGWQFVPTGEFCCYAFKRNVLDGDGFTIMPHIITDGKDVFLGGSKIYYCPYCGKKIELEKEVKQ